MGDARSVLLVEDDEPTRERLAAAIGAQPRVRLVGQAGTCAAARALLEAEAPQVLLTDLGLPDGSGVDLIREACAREPRPLVMVITIFGDEKSVVGAIEAGADGYLLKDGSSAYVAESIAQLLDGGSPISPPIASYLLRRFREPALAEPSQPDASPESAASVPQLTERETEVLRLIAKGFSFPEIAEVLGISAHTVTTHVRKIYRKLEVQSRGSAVYEAVHLGLISMDD